MLLLRYRRVDGFKCEGDLLSSEDGSNFTTAFVFTHTTYEDMIRSIAKYIPAGGTPIFFQRTDKQGLNPYALPPVIANYIKTDVEKAIKMLSFDSPTASEILAKLKQNGVKQSAPKPNRTRSLPSGYPKEVDTIGKEVYVRVTYDHSVECPGCGHLISDSYKTDICCPHCNMSVQATLPPFIGWLKVLVKDLLSSGRNVFYLPRRWNPHRGFLDRHQLLGLLGSSKRKQK